MLYWRMGRQCTIKLVARFGIAQLALSGSGASDSAVCDNDADVLIAIDDPAGSKRYFGVWSFLEDILGCLVDLVTEKAFRIEMRTLLEQALIDA